MRHVRAKVALAVVFALLCPRAQAAGIYFSDRGVRPMGRAGAFVAGADDLGAIWYNPAGLADAGTSILSDAAWLRFSADYTRALRIVDADGTVRTVASDEVHGSSPVIPIPTLAGSLVLDEKKQWTIAGGVFAPYPAIVTYPSTVNGKPSPARYALGSYDGTLLAIIGGFAAYKPIETLRIGAGVQALVGYYQTNATFSASPQDRLLGAPEQPEFDAASAIRVGPIFAPSASAGAIWLPEPRLRIGVSAQAPTIVSADAKLKIRLPSDVAFDGATVTGDTMHVRFELPAILRAGIEARPWPELRVEIAYVRELWTTHHAIDAANRNVFIQGVTGAPPQVRVPDISFPRQFDNSSSYRLGGEYRFALRGYTFDARAGVAYETSAVPVPYVSLLSLDMDKVIGSLGGSIHVGDHWRFDAVWAHFFASSVQVAPDVARIVRVNPLKGNAPLEAVNGGSYHASADLIGFGLNYVF
jgi:long-chain fatty acid transport protein